MIIVVVTVFDFPPSFGSQVGDSLRIYFTPDLYVPYDKLEFPSLRPAHDVVPT